MRVAILAWYDHAGRRLAFRGATDPYAILVSEAMAQQTQAARAAEAWTGFLAAFPTLELLAAASPADVLRAWRGLGYNRRALALRRAAIDTVARHGGRLPADVEALEGLPGIGPYTARAVAALAFGLPVGAVDTNVRRVLVRSVLGAEPGSAAVRPRDIQALADGAVARDRPGDWTHALMDVGAMFCRPRTPLCAACPARQWCRTARIRLATGPSGATRASSSRETPATSSRATREPREPYGSSRRWLRGRILDRLRDGPDGEWIRMEPTAGGHDHAAVAAALAALEADGLVERHPSEALAARLPLA